MNEPGSPPQSTLLHNTGVPPRRQIFFEAQRINHRATWFEIPANTPPGIIALAKLAGLGRPRTTESAERKLRELVAARIADLPYPAAVLVSRERPPACEGETDLATVIAVLAKSSGHVYLRDKEPNFDHVQPGAGLALLVPRSWSKS